MGIVLSKVWSVLFNSQKEARILMLGLDAAGKTTILYKLKLGESTITIPTIGFNVETVQYKNINFTVWDVGGQHLVRPLWKHYYPGTNALIFVIDSNDRERVNEAKEELWGLLNAPELQDAILLILANKQDLPHAMLPADLTEKLELQKLASNRKWHLQATCAVSGESVYEGLDWLGSELAKS